jgi:endonuclease/exonuclease/phosphatase family metal-dependent hydrolase
VGSAVRRRRWTGPPPLLVLATVLAFVLVPVLGGSDSGFASDGRSGVSASLAGDSAPEIPLLGAKPPARAGETLERRDLIGVVTMNQYIQLSEDQARADALAVAGQPGADVVGWQEAWNSRPVFRTLRRQGWDTKRFPSSAKELAVSWRRSTFELVSSAARRVAYGVDSSGGRYPFGNRFVVRVTLRHKPSGRLLSVINTHLPRMSEDPERPGRYTTTRNAAKARFALKRMRKTWQLAPGRWVVGTGDYNFDARADQRIGVPGGPARTLGPVATSSYAELGIGDLPTTHPPTGRYIDYVHARKSDLKSGEVRFLSQRTMTGLNSDHRPLLVRLALT